MVIDNSAQLLINSLDDIKAGQFYDAHEILEVLWFPRRFEKNNEVNLIKGLINALVSLELLKRDKKEPSAKVWKNYLKYRPLLYKVNSPHLNKYHQIARHVENIKNKSF